MNVLSIIIDIALVALFFVLVFFITKAGFARTVYKIGKTWLSFFCSIMLGPWVASTLQGLFLRSAITGGIHNTLHDLIQNNPNGYNLNELFENLPDALTNFLNNYGINIAQLEAEFGPTTQASEDIIEAISLRIADPCVEMVSSLIGHVVCFVVPLIVFVWLSMKIRRTRIPFFRFMDRVSGFIMGVVIGYCAALVLSFAAHTVFQVVVAFDSSLPIMDVYNKSYVFKFLSEVDTVGGIKHVVDMLI